MDRLRALFLSPAARPLRFAGTGGLAGATQLLLLGLMTHRGWDAALSNLFAFVLAAQLNFMLSVRFTWRDRLGSAQGAGPTLARRWALYHASIALMAVVNLATFAAARPLLPALGAALTGIAAGSTGNYLLGDRLVFRGLARTVSPERRVAA